MANNESFEFIIEQMVDHAIKEFKSTENSKLLQEKLDRMKRDCDDMFSEDEKVFANDCFRLISEAGGQEKIYVYHRVLLDCAGLLKWLGVLA